MKINLPKQVEFIIDKIYENGHEAFIVGGCVRDSILGIKPNDYDITTNAKPDEVIEIFKDYKIIDNGIKHGTIGLIIDKDIYEITTYRIESEYEGNRRPKDVKFTSNIIEDLKRRDFTINSIAYNYKRGLIDVFDGMNDIHRKVVKTVGDPDERFNEDGLRIVRAIRFSSKLGFDIESKTLKSIYKNSYIVKEISKERITDEVNKIILSKNPQQIILLYTTGILQSLGIYCDLNGNEYNMLKKYSEILVQCSENLEERLLMLEYLISNKEITDMSNKEDENIKYYKENIQPKSIVNKLKYSKYISNHCNKLIEYMFIDENNIDLIKIKKILNKIGAKNLNQVFKLKKMYYEYNLKNDSYNESFKIKYNLLNNYINKIECIEKNKECYMIKDLDINGSILEGLGYKGIDIGNKLNYLLEEVIKNPSLNKRENLMKLLR
ncbi:CCA tRNA nucleotidyltransferase [Romboutsia sp.]|uniref:CCA tRNA nucleotidyltransferase n=1 Tax=Romboutsia sp. TaxID=1965302 RepID=UPI002C8E200B|nr:CCA tRNA nucleotidyltransferase [Romboutsia sp.]HSQ88440.1 CCA tRNA nucleotidyltransferase [Romboutsia sp.]